MNINKKKKIILAFVVLTELIAGSVFLLNFYQRKIVHKAPDPDKIAIIKKENLIFPGESEYQYYYELKPNIEEVDKKDWLPYEARYTYNGDGLNERFDYSTEKPANTFRIITLGDSFTYGHYVNTKDNWTERLEDMLNAPISDFPEIKKFEVINLGMPAFDIPYIVKRYRDVGEKYNPDLIIWFESGSGFRRLNELMTPLIKSCEQTKIQTLTEKKQEYNVCWHQAQDEIQNKYSYATINQFISQCLVDFFSKVDQKKVLFFTFEETTLDEQEINTLNIWQKDFPNVHFLSIVPSVRRLNQVVADGHPNADGHQTIADTIYNYLKNQYFSDVDDF